METPKVQNQESSEMMRSACTCFNCEDDSPERATAFEADAIAGHEGWVLGLDPDSDDCDAVFACSRCAIFLVDAHPVKPLAGCMVDIEGMTREEKDSRIRGLHVQALGLWPTMEGIIDDLKALGPHSKDGDNALANTREWLDQLSKR